MMKKQCFLALVVILDSMYRWKKDVALKIMFWNLAIRHIRLMWDLRKTVT